MKTPKVKATAAQRRNTAAVRGLSLKNRSAAYRENAARDVTGESTLGLWLVGVPGVCAARPCAFFACMSL